MSGGDRGAKARGLSAEEQRDLLLEISRRSRGTLDLGGTLDRLLDALASVVDYDAAGIFALNAEIYPTRERPKGIIAGVARRGFLDRPVEEDAMLSAGRGLVGAAIESGRSVLVADVRQDSRYVVGRAETLSEMAVPIAVDGKTIAALDVESDSLAAFDEHDLELLEFFAEAAALAIEKALLHRHLIEHGQTDHQLRLAGEVQQGLLPRAAPDLAGWEIAGLCRPSLEVGGDLWDDFPLGHGRRGLVIGDVAGKGVPAALIMATFRALLRARRETEKGPAATVAAVSRLLRESSTLRTFVTCCYGVLDPEQGEFRYSSCGHPPGLVARAGGPVEELDNCGPALGVFEDESFVERHLVLEPGDRLLLFTDGLLEAADPEGEPFGLERVHAALEATRGQSARRLAGELVRRAADFVASPHLADDLTLVILRRLEVTG